MKECEICFQGLVDDGREPKVLSCGHTFCNVCVDGLIAVTKLNCPTCRDPFTVSAVRTNFALRDLLFVCSQSQPQVFSPVEEIHKDILGASPVPVKLDPGPPGLTHAVRSGATTEASALRMSDRRENATSTILDLEVGHHVHYFSTTHGKLISATITAVNRKKGTYNLDCKADVPPERIQRLDALVSARGKRPLGDCSTSRVARQVAEYEALMGISFGSRSVPPQRPVPPQKPLPPLRLDALPEWTTTQSRSAQMSSDEDTSIRPIGKCRTPELTQQPVPPQRPVPRLDAVSEVATAQSRSAQMSLDEDTSTRLNALISARGERPLDDCPTQGPDRYSLPSWVLELDGRIHEKKQTKYNRSRTF